MPGLRVIVFGYDELVLASVGVAAEAGAEVAGVVFPWNRSDSRTGQVRAQVAGQGRLLFTQPPRSQCAAFAERLRALNPDLALVWSYPLILPPALLELPRLGCVNVHFGLLPEYRGANGLAWALVNGETETGVTLHHLDAGIDTGPLIARVRLPIAREDDIVSLMRAARAAGIGLLRRCWPQVAAGTAPRTPQDESRAHHYRPRTAEDGRIDWSAPALRISNLVRSLVYPFPGAFTSWRGRTLVIRRAMPVPTADDSWPPGSVERVDETGVRVATGDGSLLVERAELHGAPVNGRLAGGIAAGDRFGD